MSLHGRSATFMNVHFSQARQRGSGPVLEVARKAGHLSLETSTAAPAGRKTQRLCNRERP
jgi:hypothetical protein